MQDKDYEKDYMGVITWGRLQCGAPQPMFGSEIKTDSPVYIRICHAVVSDMGGTPTDKHIHGKHPEYTLSQLLYNVPTHYSNLASAEGAIKRYAQSGIIEKFWKDKP